MVNRLTLLRSLAPILALGVIALGMPRASADESDGKLVAAVSTAPRPKTAPRAAPAKRSTAKTAAVSKPAATAPAAVPVAVGRQFISPDVASSQISGDRVNMRTGPGLQNPVITTLRGGEYVKAKSVQDGWMEVEWPQSVPVWIGKENVQAAPNTPDAAATVSAAKARVFSAATPQSFVLAKLDAGTRVSIVGQEGNWYKIKPPESAVAFVSAKYVITGVTPAVETAPQAKTAAAATAQTAALPAPAVPAPQPALAEKVGVPDLTQPLPASADAIARPKEDFVTVIEEIKNELKATAPAKTGRARKEADDQEQARLDAVVRRLDEVEAARVLAEAQKKADAEEQARLAEAKRLDEAETARMVAEVKKKADDEERARVAEETKKKAEADEWARRDAKLRQIQERDSARLAADTKKKADADVAPAPASIAVPRDGLFVDPAAAAPAKPVRIEAPAEPIPAPAEPVQLPKGATVAPKSRNAGTITLTGAERRMLAQVEAENKAAALSALAETKALNVTGPTAAAEPRVLSYESPAPAESDEQHAAAVAAAAATTRRAHAKYVVPSQAPARIVNRAEVVHVADDDQESATPVASPRTADAAPQTPAAQPSVVPARGIPELPSPSGAPPASYRLKPFFESQVRSGDSAQKLIAAEGTLERRSTSPVAGADFALVKDGCTLHYLAARPTVSLEGFVGRRVSVTGCALQGSTSECSVLEVGSISACE